MGKLPDPKFWRGKRVLVTGAEGFKGRWLVRWLTMLGGIVYTTHRTDITNIHSITNLIAQASPEIVIHMAAVTTVQEAFEDPVKAMETNIVGTTTLLHVLSQLKVAKVILNVTTDKVYHIDGMDRGYTELDSLGGLEPYAVSKVGSELVSKMYQRTYKLPLATARAGNVIGGGDWKQSRIIPNFVFAYRDGKSMQVNVDAVRPWQYVLDCLCGYLLLCERLYENNAFVGAWNFASNEYESRSVQWIVDEMNRYVVPKVPYTLIDDRGYYETKSLKLCSDKARKVLGWEPKYDMEQTIKRTAQWYVQYLTGMPAEKLYTSELEDYMDEWS